MIPERARSWTGWPTGNRIRRARGNVRSGAEPVATDQPLTRMSEPVFLRHARGLTLDEVAALCRRRAAGDGRARAPHRQCRRARPRRPARPLLLRQQELRGGGRRHPCRRLPDDACARASAAGAGRGARQCASPIAPSSWWRARLFPHALRPSSLYAAGEAPAFGRRPCACRARGWKTALPSIPAPSSGRAPRSVPAP